MIKFLKCSFLFILIISSNRTLATTYYTVSTGDIATGAIWSTVSTTSTPGALFSSLPAPANGDILYIDDNLDITTNWTALGSVNVTIYLNSTLTFNGGKIALGVNSSIIFQSSSAKAVSIGPGNSDKISIGPGPAQWDGNDPNLTGPGTLDKNSNGALPIELLYFKASKGVNKIALSWGTSSEKNLDYFDIEKSSDGKAFQSIARVNGHGTTNERNDYSLDYEKPYIGKNYYRLKSVDFDGYTEYFNVVMVDFDRSKVFSIYPNPSNGITITAETNFVPQTRAFIAIYSSSGSEIGRFEVFGDKSQLTMPVKLASGLYYAKYISGEFTSTNRVVVK
jgi:hypothetical protein